MLQKIKLMALVCLLSGWTGLAFAQNAGGKTGGAAPATTGSAQTLGQLLEATPGFSKLQAALQAADMAPVLESPGPFTVFAPTDSAFDKMPGEDTEDLLKIENKDKLLSILRYHIVPGRVTADQLQKMNILKTVETAELSVRRVKDRVMVNGGEIRQPGIQASNGVIYVIDKVLVPSEQRIMGNTGSSTDNK